MPFKIPVQSFHQGPHRPISTRAAARSDIHRAENASGANLPWLPRLRAFKSDGLLVPAAARLKARLKGSRRLRRLRARLRCWLGDARNLLQHGWGAPKIGQRLFVDPAGIQKATRRWLFHRSDCGKVVGGDWDLDLVSVEQLDKIDLVSRRVRDGLSWDELGMYRLMMRLIGKSRDGVYDGCRTIEDVVLRYRRLDTLIDHFKAGSPFLEGESLGQIREQGGVLVHIGREGQFVFGRTGCHRLAIARSLKLPTIPVLLGVVHAQALASGRFKDVLERSRQLHRVLER